MRYTTVFTVLAAWGLWAVPSLAAPGTAGIEALLQRRMPSHADKFTFSLDKSDATESTGNEKEADTYTVSNGPRGSIHISGNTEISLAMGLRWYLTTMLKVDIYWFIGSRLDLAPRSMPRLDSPHHRSSIVPWRYHFNTVTFSYTAAFWQWEDWELQLDWMALHGINLPLAWVGYEKVFLDTMQEAGLSQEEVIEFFSGPAFQAWNRFGNIQSSWGGLLPLSWIEDQFQMGKLIVARMVELGMTPVLPAFTGYVPLNTTNVYLNASIIRGDSWNGFPDEYTKDAFLLPYDPLYSQLQKSFITKQQEYFGKVTHIYTLDQYNEIDPLSGDLGYLANVSEATIKSLKAADPDAVWMMQGWLFLNDGFWTNPRIEAYLGTVNNSDMLILDLKSDTFPVWQRTDSYFGKSWIWCMLHDFGGNMGLYGQIENSTVTPIQALSESRSMVGIGASMEGQEGNEIMYDITFDQAWSKTPIDPKQYSEYWVAARYSSASIQHLPQSLYDAWHGLIHTVYNNTNLTAANLVPKAVYVQYPILSQTFPWLYNPETLVTNWMDMLNAGWKQPALWTDSSYIFDLVDVTRQVLSNAFTQLFFEYVEQIQQSRISTAKETGEAMLSILHDLDEILQLSGFAHFSLGAWIESARSWAKGQDESVADFYEYDARNQITLWGPTGEINDYAAKEWAGLISTYYIQRWELFFNYTNSGQSASDLQAAIISFEFSWQDLHWLSVQNANVEKSNVQQLQSKIAGVASNGQIRS